MTDPIPEEIQALDLLVKDFNCLKNAKDLQQIMGKSSKKPEKLPKYHWKEKLQEEDQIGITELRVMTTHMKKPLEGVNCRFELTRERCRQN